MTLRIGTLCVLAVTSCFAIHWYFCYTKIPKKYISSISRKHILYGRCIYFQKLNECLLLSK